MMKKYWNGIKRGYLGRNWIWQLLAIFVIWRLALALIAVFAVEFVPLKGENFWRTGSYYPTNPLVWSWANFDGEHYLRIAREGYGYLQHAFFPLYPTLIEFFSFGNVELQMYVGLVVSHISFFLALLLLWKVVRFDYSEKIAFYSIFALLVFPTSFFFVSLYTESLFLLLVLASFFAARHALWGKAGMLGAFLSATRITGVLLLPALFVEWWEQNQDKKIHVNKKILTWGGILLTLGGLFWYMHFLHRTTGDPFAFYTEQPFFEQERDSGKIILLPQVFWRYIKMIFTVERGVYYIPIVFELASAFLMLCLLVLGFLYKLRFSYLLYAFLGFILPTLTGTFVSLPRYMLVLFPAFIVLGIFLSKRGFFSRMLILTLFFILLFLETALFLRGYWVA